MDPQELNSSFMDPQGLSDEWEFGLQVHQSAFGGEAALCILHRMIEEEQSTGRAHDA